MKYIISICFVILGISALAISFAGFNTKFVNNYFTFPADNFAGYEYEMQYKLIASNYEYEYIKSPDGITPPQLKIKAKDGQEVILLLSSTLYQDGSMTSDPMELFGFFKVSENGNSVKYIPNKTCNYVIIPVRFVPGHPFRNIGYYVTVDSHKYMLDFNTPTTDTKRINPFDYISCFEK